MHWLLAHAIGDFLLQNHAMQQKRELHIVCAWHILTYSLPFWFATPYAWWQILLVMVQHYLQDRYDWAARWQARMRQTPASEWPTGRLLVDQTLHVVWMYTVFEVLGG